MQFNKIIVWEMVKTITLLSLCRTAADREGLGISEGSTTAEGSKKEYCSLIQTAYYRANCYGFI